jgi:hypothetical protein
MPELNAAMPEPIAAAQEQTQSLMHRMLEHPKALIVAGAFSVSSMLGGGAVIAEKVLAESSPVTIENLGCFSFDNPSIVTGTALLATPDTGVDIIVDGIDHTNTVTAGDTITFTSHFQGGKQITVEVTGNSGLDYKQSFEADTSCVIDPTQTTTPTTEAPTSTEGPTTTHAPTTTEAPTSTEGPTTTHAPTTTEAPTSTEGPTTTQNAPTTSEQGPATTDQASDTTDDGKPTNPQKTGAANDQQSTPNQAPVATPVEQEPDYTG